MVDSRKIHLILCLPLIFCSNLGVFGESILGFSKNLIGSRGFDIYSLVIGSVLGVFFYKCEK